MLILPLNDTHDRKQFDCGSEELNGWFYRTAKQHMQKRVSSTFVAVAEPSSTDVLGFYSLNISEIINANLPRHLGKRLPDKVPVFRLGRLATAMDHQGKHIGEYLLFDAMDRVTLLSKEVGGAGLVVNAKPAAVDFYRQYGFLQMPDHPLNLILPF